MKRKTKENQTPQKRKKGELGGQRRLFLVLNVGEERQGLIERSQKQKGVRLDV